MPRPYRLACVQADEAHPRTLARQSANMCIVCAGFTLAAVLQDRYMAAFHSEPCPMAAGLLKR